MKRKKKAASSERSRTYRGSALVSMHVEVDLGEVEIESAAAAKRHFEREAQSPLSDCGRLELVRHSSHCGVDLVQVVVRRTGGNSRPSS